MKDFIKEREKEFKQMKDFCLFNLRGNNKYYNRFQPQFVPLFTL